MKKNHYQYLCGALFVVLVAAIWHVSRNSAPSAVAEDGGDERGPSGFRSEWRERYDQENSRKRVIPGRKSIAFYEAALEKYPDMKPEYRDVPDERNGYLQLLLIVEGWDATVLPDDLRNMLQGNGEWDADKLRAWYEQNRQLVEKVLAVTTLPERSSKGISFERVYGKASKDGTMDLARILSGLSRMAGDAGDEDGALRFIKGCIGIDAQLSGTEAPGFLAGVLGETARSRAEKLFTEHHFSRLAGDPEALRKWRDAVLVRAEPAEQIRRMYLGEWNWMVRHHIGAVIVGEHSEAGGAVQIRNPDGFMDAYTGGYRAWMADLTGQEPGRLNLTGWKDAPAGDHLDGDAADMLEGAFSGISGLTQNFGHTMTRTSQAAAAVSILLGEEPPVDPVSGLPFIWDPATRTLARPEGDKDEILHVP